MKPSDEYKEIGSINLNTNKKLSLMMQLGFLLIAAVGAGSIFLFSLWKTNVIPTWLILFSCVVVMMIHEGIHVAAMKLFSKEKINFTFKFPTVAVGCDFLFTKAQFIMVAIAPVVILGMILFACLLLMSKETFLLSVLLTLNFAGASGDFVQIHMVCKYPKHTYFSDNGDVTKIYSKA